MRHQTGGEKLFVLTPAPYVPMGQQSDGRVDDVIVYPDAYTMLPTWPIRQTSYFHVF